MNKFILLLSLFLCSLVAAQCTITGNASIANNEQASYSVENEIAQCKDCHQWSALGENAQITGDNRQSSVQFTASTSGRKTISAVVLTRKGIVQCSKNIDVVDNSVSNGERTTNQTVTETVSNCDISISQFKEVKYADTVVSFFPTGEDQNYKFTWTATYSDGSEKTSKEKVPQFSYDKTTGIKTVKLQIISSKCLRSFSKIYDDNYWVYFK